MCRCTSQVNIWVKVVICAVSYTYINISSISCWPFLSRTHHHGEQKSNSTVTIIDIVNNSRNRLVTPTPRHPLKDDTIIKVIVELKDGIAWKYNTTIDVSCVFRILILDKSSAVNCRVINMRINMLHLSFIAH
jgi:hypothetical protein